MPAFPWKAFTTIEPEGECLVMASLLPLKSYWRIPVFLRLTMAIRRQLEGSEGLIGYSLVAELPSKRFLTLSAWSDQQHLSAFAAAMPHRDVMRRLRPHMAATTFVTWKALGRDLPITWETARKRLGQDTTV